MSYLEKLLAAKERAEAAGIPNHGTSFREPPFKAVTLKQCVMTAKKAIRDMPALTSTDPVRCCLPLTTTVSDALHLAGYSHEITFGNVIRQGKPLLSNVSDGALIEAFRAPAPEARSWPNFYCWITLGDGSILDFALRLRGALPVDMDKVAESFLYLAPGEQDPKLRFEPVLVGDAVPEPTRSPKR